jgi:hypothetical protein
MSVSRKRTVPHSNVVAQEIRDQEVVRANRELAAYFKGQRTEREARGALKIIKAFIRDREHMDPANRRPLPGEGVEKSKRKIAERTMKTSDQKTRRRRARRQPAGADSEKGSVGPGASPADPAPGSADRDQS